MFQTGFILNRRDDWLFFLGLPLVAVAIGFASQRWLSSIAMVSFTLWITVPHHFVTWLRAYAVKEDFARWREALILGPLVIMAVTLGGSLWAPMTLVLLLWSWDHQHSIMQQYGFARIYDHKAGSGGPNAARFDFGLNWILYLNLLIVSPLYSDFWIRELYRFGVPIEATTILALQNASALLAVIGVAAYGGHLLWSIRQGHSINPFKIGFIGASYFTWYATAWWSGSILVAKIAHSIMHGVQYIVITHAYMRRRGDPNTSWTSWLAQPRHLLVFLALCLAYAVVYQIAIGQPLASFGFGFVEFARDYAVPIPELGKAAYTERQSAELFAALVIHGAALVHYFVDSFIWQVSDDKVREGL